MIYTPGTPCAADSDCTKFQPATCNDEMCLLVIPTTTAAPPAPTTPPANANPKPGKVNSATSLSQSLSRLKM